MNTQPKGFTRVEILVVAMILVILVGTVVVSLNPGRQFSQARNTQRWEDVSTLADAISSRLATLHNAWGRDCDALPAVGDVTPVAAHGFNLYDCIVPSYLQKMVADPNKPDVTALILPTWDSGYVFERLPGGHFKISAPSAELGEEISVTK